MPSNSPMYDVAVVGGGGRRNGRRGRCRSGWGKWSIAPKVADLNPRTANPLFMNRSWFPGDFPVCFQAPAFIAPTAVLRLSWGISDRR